MKGWKGPLVVLEYPGGKGGGMNTARCREQVLEGVLKDFYKQMDVERDGVIFQQDGAASHRSKSMKKWFSDHEIPLFFHPASSPDISPIEPVWHELKSSYEAFHILQTQPSNL
jgi:transposase